MHDVKIYKPKAVVSRYYFLLFSLPKWQILVSLLVLASIIQLLILGSNAIPIVLNGVLVAIVYSLYSRLSEKSVFYKFKRVVGLSLAVVIYSALYTFFIRDILIPLVSSSTLLIVVTLGLDGTSTGRYLVASSPVIATLVLLCVMGYLKTVDIFLGLSFIFLLIITDYLIYRFMSRRKVHSLSLPDIGTMFLQNWLDRRLTIEHAFEEMGEVKSVHPRVLQMGDLLLVYTDVHYGPFSNVGSSILPVVLQESLRKIGFSNVLTLHGLGSHDRNIVSSSHRASYVDKIIDLLINRERMALRYQGSFLARNNEWRVMGLVFDKISLLIVSRNKRGIDDLPYSIQEEYELKAKSIGLPDLVILDSHNWELDDKPNLNGLRALLDESLVKIKEISSRPGVDVLYKYQCFHTSAPGLVDGYGCIICITGEGREEACLVYLRGNNMKPGVRDYIVERAKHLGTELIEVITNDEHTETGTRSRIIYTPVHDSPELLETIEKVSRDLANRPYNRGAWLYNTRLDVKLMGDSIELLKKELPGSVKESAILLLTYVFASPIILSILMNIVLG